MFKIVRNLVRNKSELEMETDEFYEDIKKELSSGRKNKALLKDIILIMLYIKNYKN